MKRLNKIDQMELDRLADELEEARSAVSEAFAAAVEATGAVNARLAEYNTVLQKAADFRDSVTAEMAGYADEKSQRWQESEAGSEYQEWRAAWENLDVEDVEDMPLPDEPLLEHAEALRDLPDEPGPL